jgi:hypothetical protein
MDVTVLQFFLHTWLLVAGTKAAAEEVRKAQTAMESFIVMG